MHESRVYSLSMIKIIIGEHIKLIGDNYGGSFIIKKISLEIKKSVERRDERA